MPIQASDWKRRMPFVTGESMPYKAQFSAEQYNKISEGLLPQAMEDKWFIYFEEPYLFLHRSWTGSPVYRVRLQTDKNDIHVIEALCVSEVIEKSTPEYQAKLIDFIISNLLLGEAKPFPKPDNISEPVSGAFQHHISGTGYAETTSKKPWWQFWK